MSHTTLESGFSAVELLITIFVGAVFIFAGYQLYGVITQGNQDASNLSIASDAAHTQLQRVIHSRDQSPYNTECSTLGSTPSGSNTWTSQSTVDQYTSDISLTIICPDATNLPNLRKASVTATYKSTGATHALYYTQ